MNTTTHPAPHHYAVEWRQGFQIGIPEVDVEHTHLFGLVRKLDLESVQDTIEELLEYVVTHFTNEQALMESSGYPDFQRHLQMHEQLGQQVADFLGGREDWTEERVQDLRKFLNKWLVGHILTHDLRFGNWYRDHRKQLAARAALPVAKHRSGWFDRLLGRP